MSIAEKLTTIAENEQKVYDAGAKSEYDKFWDAYQKNGSKTDYAHAFRHMTKDICKPKYNIKTTSLEGTFYYLTWLTDFDEWLESCGITLDTSKATTLYLGFQGCSNLTKIGTIDMSSSTQNFRLFFNCAALREVGRCIVSEATTYQQTFYNTASLVTINFEGVIANNGLDFSLSGKLSHDSLMSIINCLKNYTGSGTTHSVTLGTTNLAKLTDAEKAIATQKGWTLA